MQKKLRGGYFIQLKDLTARYVPQVPKKYILILIQSIINI
jgi:hypothetical protein